MRAKLLITLSLVVIGCQSIEEATDTSTAPSDLGTNPGRDVDTSPDSAAAADARTPDMASPRDASAPTDLTVSDIGTDVATATDTGGGIDMVIPTDMPICPDPYEPNNVVSEATPITASSTITAANCGFDDDDVYAINLTAGQTITLTHSFVNNAGNLDLNLHAPSQAADVGKNGSYAAITFGFTDVETLTHVAQETGTYYVLSFNNNDTQNAYTLAIDVQ